MDKKGFALLETITVLLILVTGIVSMYGTYVKLTSNMNRRSYYDNVSDLFKVDLIRSELDETKLNDNDFIEINKYNCRKYFKGTTFVDERCSKMFDDINVDGV